MPTDGCQTEGCACPPGGCVDDSQYLQARAYHVACEQGGDQCSPVEQAIDQAPVVKTFGDLLNLAYAPDKGQALKTLGLQILSNVSDGLFGATIGGDIEGQLPLYSGGKTQGILDIGTDQIPLISGKNGPAADMPLDAPGMPKSWMIRDHVEAHASAAMRQLEVSEADLYINKAPCAGPMGCNANLPHMLPEGATLRVHIQNGVNDWEVRSYVGLPDSEWNWP